MRDMEWSDKGFVLSARRHGENSSLVMLFTESHGRHAGLVLGGQGRRARGLYQAGRGTMLFSPARLAQTFIRQEGIMLFSPARLVD